MARLKLPFSKSSERVFSSQGSEGEDHTAGMALVKLGEDLGLRDHSCSKNCPNPGQPHSSPQLWLTLSLLAKRARGLLLQCPFALSLDVRQVVHDLEYSPTEIVTLEKEACKMTNSTLFCVYAKKRKRKKQKHVLLCVQRNRPSRVLR